MTKLKADGKFRRFSVQSTSYSDLKKVDGRNQLEQQRVSSSLSDTRTYKSQRAVNHGRYSVFPDIKYNIDTQNRKEAMRSDSTASLSGMSLLPKRAKSTKGSVYNPPDGISFNPESARVSYSRLDQRKDEVMKYGAPVKETYSNSRLSPEGYSGNQSTLSAENLIVKGLRPSTNKTEEDGYFTEKDSKRDHDTTPENDFYDFEGFRLKSAKPNVWLKIKKKRDRKKIHGEDVEESSDDSEDLVGFTYTFLHDIGFFLQSTKIGIILFKVHVDRALRPQKSVILKVQKNKIVTFIKMFKTSVSLIRIWFTSVILWKSFNK